MTDTKLTKSSVKSYHGGNDIHGIDNLRLDLSVTCNKLGMVDGFYEHLTKDRFAYLVGHYPPSQDDDELKMAYDTFLGRRSPNYVSSDSVSPDSVSPNYVPSSRVIFGNGASELIDLTIRSIPTGDWKTNQVVTQYREYGNSCQRMGRRQLAHDDKSAILTVIVNPNNPTGDFLEQSAMTQYVDEYVANDSYLIVDESMLFWYGPDWMSHSFLRSDYSERLRRERGIRVIVVQSWTKIFDGCGLRMGSVVVFDDTQYHTMLANQPPWSLNAIAREYLIYAFARPDYLIRTWKSVPNWRRSMIRTLAAIDPKWTFHGADFVSWIWIDTHDSELARRITDDSLKAGFPIRNGTEGYAMPTFVRIAVCDPALIADWFDVVRVAVRRRTISPPCSRPLHIETFDTSENEVRKSLIIERTIVSIDKIHIHESYVSELADALENYILRTDFGIAVPTIIVGRVDDATDDDATDDAASAAAESFVVDGPHRLEVLRRLGYRMIPITVVDYLNPLIYILPPQKLSTDGEPSDAIDRKNYILKCDMIDLVQKGLLMPPKSTQHVVALSGGYVPVVILGSHMVGNISILI